MAGRNVEFASNGGRASGYLSAPASGTGPGVLVIQEWWGLNSHVRSLADRFAGEGFVALAPDLYHGRETREPDEAGKLLMALDVDQAARDLRGAASLPARPRAARRGGSSAWSGSAWAASSRSTPARSRPTRSARSSTSTASTRTSSRTGRSCRRRCSGCSPRRTATSTPRRSATLEAQVRAAGKQIETHIYPGVDHAFFNDERPEVYSPDAASDAWRRTLAFLRAHLREWAAMAGVGRALVADAPSLRPSGADRREPGRAGAASSTGRSCSLPCSAIVLLILPGRAGRDLDPAAARAGSDGRRGGARRGSSRSATGSAASAGTRAPRPTSRGSSGAPARCSTWPARPTGACAGVTIVGTNGKGSTGAILEAILRAAGLRTGVYSQPHLRDYRERIRIDGAPVAAAAFAAARRAAARRWSPSWRARTRRPASRPRSS